MDVMRKEKDSMGEVEVPADAYWGAQTQRAIENFPVSGIALPPSFIRAMALIKRACAAANQELKLLDPRLAAAILQACDEIAAGTFADQFPLDVFQTGSGTSTNMNVNEVVATRANEILTGSKHTRAPVHPNDHVNMGQSSNDVIPTAIHAAATLETTERLLPAIDLLHAMLVEKQKSFGSVVKTGRTHLMDATPITLAQEISAWASQVQHARVRITETLPRLADLAIGGTAVGTGINTKPGFGAMVARKLSELTGVKFREAANHFEAQATQDAALELSGQLKTYATTLAKIANDLRLMNSGPMAGLAELRLPALQPGSSIMPGKVNPVIPEAVRMVAAQVVGNDAVIAAGNMAGEFQLNMMLPVIAHNLIQSITLLANVSRLLAEKTIRGFEVNVEHIAELLGRNPILATVLNPIIGYEKAAEVVKKALKENKTVKEVVVELGYLSSEEAGRLLDPSVMTRPGFSGE